MLVFRVAGIAQRFEELFVAGRAGAILRRAGVLSGNAHAPVDRCVQRYDVLDPVQHAGPATGAGQVEARVHGAEPAAHGNDGGLKGKKSATSTSATGPQQPHLARRRLHSVEAAAEDRPPFSRLRVQRAADTRSRLCRADS